MRKNKRKHPKAPHLSRKEWVETDPTGAKIRVTQERRGILCTTTRHYDATNLHALKPVSPREAFEQYRECLRKQLKTWGLPTDRTTSSRYWTVQLELKTKPLSPQRKAGELFSILTDTIARDGIEPHLWHICRLMQSYSDYQISRINSLADSAINARKVRAAGPRTRARIRQETHLVVRRCVREHIDRHPTHEGRVKKITGAIRNSVNEEIQRKGFLPKNKAGLSELTIQRYVRELAQR